MAKLPTKTDKLEVLRRVAVQRASNLLPSVFTYLGNLLADDDAPHGAKLQASTIILDRALGKAKEIKEITATVDLNTQHLEALKTINQAFLDKARETQEVIDLTPLPVSETGDTPINNKALAADGRRSQAATAPEADQDGAGAAAEAPPSFSPGGGK